MGILWCEGVRFLFVCGVEKEGARAREKRAGEKERASERASKREMETARVGERARDIERERARERESGRAGEREKECARERAGARERQQEKIHAHAYTPWYGVEGSYSTILNPCRDISLMHPVAILQ